MFSPQEPPPTGVVVARSVQTRNITEDGAHLSVRAICHSPEICVQCVCVWWLSLLFWCFQSHLPAWKEFSGLFSVSLETESREMVIGMSTLLGYLAWHIKKYPLEAVNSVSWGRRGWSGSLFLQEDPCLKTCYFYCAVDSSVSQHLGKSSTAQEGACRQAGRQD